MESEWEIKSRAHCFARTGKYGQKVAMWVRPEGKEVTLQTVLTAEPTR